jgi:hypothetical protein
LFAVFADVNPISIEVLVDEDLGAEATKEHTLLKAKLGGTQNNRVFTFFGIEAPQRVPEAQLAEAEGKKKNTKGKPTGAAGGKPKKTSKGCGNTTGALEKKKRRGESGGVRLKKLSRLIDTFFTQSSLRSKGDFKERFESSGDSTTAKRAPAALVSTVPVSARPAFSQQLSEPEPKSDGKVWARPRVAAASAVEVEKSSERRPSA